LAHPLRLHGKITTEFRNLAFDDMWQVGASEPPLSFARGM
jgi:hypothetical protein